MPKLPLPPLSLGIPLDCGDFVVASSSDVSAVWSWDLMQAPTAPIRDAIIAGQFATAFALLKASRRAAAQNDPLRATGPALDDIGGERGIYRQIGEPDDPPNAVLYGPPAVAYRQRVNAEPNVVDPNDVIAAANNVLAPYTSISCRYAEQSDGFFLDDGSSTVFSSHVFQELPTPLVPNLTPPNDVMTVPNYPDRLYSSATPAGLLSIPNRRPPGAMLNGDTYARWFLLSLPDISAVDSDVAAVAAHANDSPGPSGSGASVSFTAGVCTLTGAANLNASMVGRPIIISNSTSPGNDVQAVVASYVSPSSCTYANPGGATDSSGAVDWAIGGASAVDDGVGLYAGGSASQEGVSEAVWLTDVNATYLFSFASTVDRIYASVVAAVEAIRMHSMRWSAVVDPGLQP